MEDMHEVIKMVAAIEEAMFDEETQIRVKFNDRWLALERACLEGEGRAAGTPLSKMILGTQEGLQGNTEIAIDESLMPGLTKMHVWLDGGDRHFKSYLLDDKTEATALEGLADLFGLSQLTNDIHKEQARVRAKFDEFDVGKNLARMQTTISPSLVTSKDNIGVVLKFISFREFGFILDKDTRHEIWFHKSSIVQDDEEGDFTFAVGEEVLYDIQISKRGKKPGLPKAINIRPLHGFAFKKLHVPLMV